MGRRRLAPGDCEEKTYPLHEWIEVSSPGVFELELALDLPAPEREVPIVSRVELVIEP